MITLECDELDIHITMKNPGEQASQALAINLLKAIEGDAETQYAFGELCWSHCQNYHEAVRWFRYAANQGHPIAQVNLAEACFDGKGVEQDLQAAFHYTLESAKNGFPQGMFNAGKCYENGWGTKRNLDEAIKWYDKAAEEGIAEAAALRDVLSQLTNASLKK
ncbi:MAG: tetratricopeptide repeat protein [Eubacteriales bacterium]|nr:tetratricopeptide repeat protein [Eubacteriales bacterium]